MRIIFGRTKNIQNYRLKNILEKENVVTYSLDVRLMITFLKEM